MTWDLLWVANVDFRGCVYYMIVRVLFGGIIPEDNVK
jgi:hypothetical protein